MQANPITQNHPVQSTITQNDTAQSTLEQSALAQNHLAQQQHHHNIAPFAQLHARGRTYPNGVPPQSVLHTPAPSAGQAFIQQGCTCHGDFCFELRWDTPQTVASIRWLGLYSEAYLAFCDISLAVSTDGKTFIPRGFWHADPWQIGQPTAQFYRFAQPQQQVLGLRFMVTTATTSTGQLPLLSLEVFDR